MMDIKKISFDIFDTLRLFTFHLYTYAEYIFRKSLPRTPKSLEGEIILVCALFDYELFSQILLNCVWSNYFHLQNFHVHACNYFMFLHQELNIFNELLLNSVLELRDTVFCLFFLSSGYWIRQRYILSPSKVLTSSHIHMQCLMHTNW